MALGCAAILTGVTLGAYGEFGVHDLGRFAQWMDTGLVIGFQGGATLAGGVSLYLIGDHPSWVASRAPTLAFRF